MRIDKHGGAFRLMFYFSRCGIANIECASSTCKSTAYVGKRSYMVVDDG